MQRVEAIPLSDMEIRRICNDAVNIVQYHELATLDSSQFLQLFLPEYNYCVVLLYELEGTNHWVSLIYRPNQRLFDFYNSYGVPPDHEYTLGIFARHITGPYLSHLLSTMTVRSNTQRIQGSKRDLATCGRWAAVRCVYHNLTNSQFNAMIHAINPVTDDDRITLLTLFTVKQVEEEGKFEI